MSKRLFSAAAAVAAVVVWLRIPEKEGELRRTMEKSVRVETADTFDDAGFVGAFASIEVSQQIYYEPGLPSVQVATSESPNSSPHSASHETLWSYTTSYRVRFVAPRWANEFYILGIDASGNDIIERWTLTPQDGGWDVVRPTHETDIGVPASMSEGATIFVVGGQYLEPSQRQNQGRPKVKRREVYRSNELPQIRSIDCDPNGRFVLLLAGNGSVHRVKMPPPESSIEPIPGPGGLLIHPYYPLYPPVQLFDGSDIVHLLEADAIYVVQNSVRGRIARVTGGTQDVVTELIDSDNDGLFEAAQTLPGYVDWNEAYFTGPDWAPGYRYKP